MGKFREILPPSRDQDHDQGKFREMAGFHGKIHEDFQRHGHFPASHDGQMLSFRVMVSLNFTTLLRVSILSVIEICISSESP